MIVLLLLSILCLHQYYHCILGEILIENSDVYITFQIDLRNVDSNTTDNKEAFKTIVFSSFENKFAEINIISKSTSDYCYNYEIPESNCVLLWNQISKYLENLEFYTLPINQTLVVSSRFAEILKLETGLESHSQVHQDIWTINYFNQKINGVFVDIGANDGITFSNSYTLEKYLNWTGLLIEPQIKHLKSLHTHRNSTIIPWCAYNRTEMMKFNVLNTRLSMMSGISEVFSSHHILSYLNISIFKESYLPCFHIQEMLDTYNIQHIDYLSVDTEGSEVPILQAIDWKRMDIDVIHVEANTYDHKVHAYNYLSNLGYKVAQLGHDLAFYK